MKRLRASEQGDSGASGLAAGAPGPAADPNTPSNAPAAPAGGSNAAATIKDALSEKAPDTQTATISALAVPTAARQEEQPQARCNGDIPQMLPQRKAD